MAGLRLYLAGLRVLLRQLLDSFHNCNKSIELPNSSKKGPNWSVVALSKESILLDSDCTWLVSVLYWDSYWTAYIIVIRASNGPILSKKDRTGVY